jgi:hypothetical protein
MPPPRQRRKKPAANGTRASRRNDRNSAWVLAKLEERFDRFAEVAALQRQQAASGVLFHRPAQEKAPDLSTGGSSSSED